MSNIRLSAGFWTETNERAWGKAVVVSALSLKCFASSEMAAGPAESLRQSWAREESQMFKALKSGALFCCSHNKLIQYASLSSSLSLSYHNGKQSHLQCKCRPLRYRIVWVIVPPVPSTKDNRYCLKSIRWCQKPVTPITTTPISL